MNRFWRRSHSTDGGCSFGNLFPSPSIDSSGVGGGVLYGVGVDAINSLGVVLLLVFVVVFLRWC